MIVVDTSALMAVLMDEPDAARCAAALELAPELLLSAGTATEAFIVADARGLGDAMSALIDGLGMTIVPLDGEGARLTALAYSRWGKGRNAAGLNFGDCFAYALAKLRDCPLLFVGEDFARTDVTAA